MTKAQFLKTKSHTAKKSYVSYQAAETKARLSNQYRRPGAPRIVPYKCLFCPHYHIGHRPTHFTIDLTEKPHD